MILCPTEPEGLAGRFIRAVSGDDAPHLDPEQSAVGRANRSVPPALAIMMNKVMQEEGIGPILGPHHARFTTVARNNPGRPRFRKVLPEPFATVFRDIGFCDAELKKYEVLLREADVAEPHVAEAVAHAQAQLAAMREMPTHDPQMTEILRYRARWNLARVQKLHPEAFDASAPDLGRYLVPLEEALGG